MVRRSVAYFKQNVVAFLALFAAVGTGGAYAANTVRSTDIVDSEVKSADVKDESLTTFDVSTFLGADIVDGTITNADLAPGVGAAWFIGRGRLTCTGGGCTIFDFRPQGFTDNLEAFPVENRLYKAPPGGLDVSNWSLTLSSPVPNGQTMVVWLIQGSSPQVFLSCSMDGPASSCSSNGT